MPPDMAPSEQLVMHAHDFEAAELLFLDDSFRHWIEAGLPPDDARWSRWLHEAPHRVFVAERAAEWLRLMQAAHESLREAELTQELNRLRRGRESR